MTRIRIEGLLAAFPKLMGTGNSSQHTFIETESVRYVYQPIENLFLLLITNKASNIVEDLETLRLLSKLVPDIAGGITEDRIEAKMFELVFAFDEVLTYGGHRENITLAQIQTNLSMESHEEKLFKMIQQSKETQAKEEADRKAKNFMAEKRASQMAGIGGGGGMEGIGGGGGGANPYEGSHGKGIDSSPSFSDERSPASSSYGAYGAGSGAQDLVPSAAAPVVPKKGMQLGGGSKKQSMMDKLVSEDNLAPLAPISTGGGASAGGGVADAPPSPAGDQYPVNITLEEKVSASLNREGALESLEVKGIMNLTANKDEALACKVILGDGRNPNFAYQTHPKVDKKLYESTSQVALKAGAFPKHKSVGVLRWSMSTAAEDQVPISINCWPEPDGGDMNVNVEYTCEKAGVELHDVRIVIPLGTAQPPDVASCDSGTHRHNRGAEELVWEVDMVDASNKTASLEFNVQQKDADAFFPIMVSFRSKQLHAGVQVATVVHSETGAPVQFGVTESVTTDTYKVE
mmetsp:Transcript_12055/g.28240  ORF Transcript_12055/g.28240 Transcript_12055/m.28240 type:complete len:518 (+) Transcript_12055:397-1950(+)|eukprot:CAMPEP_0172607348 /NCGR_PEP_ID=MMETSP1068-20121228/27541_1 /TAXON_ID=35684 /ORGANISM="Pseudopedinella elastica, Strain CCMP716" /LENGTH=517 /DNA_ID=CAMNT_0013410321 /DNA_START=320 /DNA_END=1873 /DNA_ORIENTATION=+